MSLEVTVWKCSPHPFDSRQLIGLPLESLLGASILDQLPPLLKEIVVFLKLSKSMCLVLSCYFLYFWMI